MKKLSKNDILIKENWNSKVEFSDDIYAMTEDTIETEFDREAVKYLNRFKDKDYRDSYSPMDRLCKEIARAIINHEVRYSATIPEYWIEDIAKLVSDDLLLNSKIDQSQEKHNEFIDKVLYEVNYSVVFQDFMDLIFEDKLSLKEYMLS